RGQFPFGYEQFALSDAGEIDLDEVNPRLDALVLLSLVLVSAVAGKFVGRRDEFDHRDYSAAGGGVDDLDKSLANGVVGEFEDQRLGHRGTGARNVRGGS